MNALDRLVLRLKRRESPGARLAYDAYRRLLELDIPDTRATKLLFGSLYAGHDFASRGLALVASKLLYEPMLRARCTSAGADLNVTAVPYIRGHARISIGNRCSFASFTLHTGRFVDAPEISFGDDCVVMSAVHFSLNKRIAIGTGVVIADRVGVQDSDGHPSSVERRLRGEHLSEADIMPVTIHDYAWIGRSAHLLKGVTIGRGAVVAAGSVVVSDVADGAVVMGVPARAVKR